MISFYRGMSEPTSDQTFDLFAKQWAAKHPDFHLDDPKVRDDIMTIISAMMSLLAVSTPEVWNKFMADCEAAAKVGVPLEIQAKIKCVVGEG